MDAFDADVLIHAVNAASQVGEPIRALLRHSTDGSVGVGSVLLWPELLSKPLRLGAQSEADELLAVLGRIELLPLDEATARLAAALGAQHGLRAADAVHLATAVAAGADRFITNNRKDFTTSITEIDVVYPDQLEP
jgi:predicted nucleic acid-binding protein